MQHTDRHIPVLLDEVREYLAINPGDVVFDGTLGAGGHARMMIEQLGDKGIFIATDQDREEMEKTKADLLALFPDRTIHTICENFRNLDTVLSDLGINSIDKALFDLGVSSMQLDDPGYGMTFREDAPLSMVMNKDTSGAIITAYDVVNDWKEETLADIIYAFGDERYSRRIASAIVAARQEKSIRTTFQLADIVKNAVPGKYANGPIHPATRTFQAIRIIVNDEFAAIKEGLAKAITLLNSGGRIAVISFHSGEDRIVKQLFKEYIDSGVIKKINKKPLIPTDDEIESNRRSRSSKLRVIEKI
jgi:16S rRNA (cytosine1402-N4)-methyltransferase